MGARAYLNATLGMAATLGALAFGTNAFAGGIIVDNDEWALSNYGYGVVPGTSVPNYVDNVAKALTGGSGNILIASDNFGLDESDLYNTLTSAGYNVTEAGAAPLDSLNLSAYKAVYLAGDVLSADYVSKLSSYVNSGGGVYIAAGTGDIPNENLY